jgi:hypothetical protein
LTASECLESMAKAPGGGDGSDARGDGTCGNDGGGGGLVCREVLELEEEEDPGAPPARWDCIAACWFDGGGKRVDGRLPPRVQRRGGRAR